MNGKFRVYDKQKKRFVKGLLIDENGKPCTLRRIDFDIKASEELDPDRYVVQFSTGLKDKNGKELFEGDRAFDHYRRTLVCEYRYFKWQWGALSRTNFRYADIYEWESYDFEIIGNIFEEVNNEQM